MYVLRVRHLVSKLDVPRKTFRFFAIKLLSACKSTKCLPLLFCIAKLSSHITPWLGWKKTWNTSCHESQDICCLLEKFENQFKGCDCTLDSVCLALKLAYHLIGLAETLCLSLELGDKTLQFRFLNFLRWFEMAPKTVAHFATTGSPWIFGLLCRIYQ